METESKKPLIILIIIAVIALIVYIGWSGSGTSTPSNGGNSSTADTQQPKQPNTPPNNDILFFANDASEGLTPEQLAEKKAEILQMVSGGKTLTDEQKKTILSLIIGEQIKKYDFTDAERKTVIDALNKN